MDDFSVAMKVSASGMRAQSERLRVVAENLANANSTGDTPGADPYRRKVPVFKDYLDRTTGSQHVQVARVAYDRTPFSLEYDPAHPAANEEGYVKLSNVNSLIESMDMREAQRSYEANLGALEAARNMAAATLRILE